MSTIEFFIQKIAIGNIYWFVNPQISSNDPHPHVCLGIYNDDNCVMMLCGTSQFDNKRRYFELAELPFETLVRIQPNHHTNTLTKDTYVDCNDVQIHDVGDLYYNETLKFNGIVSDAELLQIKEGIEISELIEQALQEQILKSFSKI
jgi:hypothetical protein